MTIGELLTKLEEAKVGREMYELVAQLYPLCRSITGQGVRDTLQILQQHIPLIRHEVPSGTKVFDWVIPREWNIRDAYIKDETGRRIVDFKQSNLHVVSYSTPIKQTLPLSDLRQHLFTLPDHPDWIPYRTSYYKESWGFCLSHEQLQKMSEGTYEVHIDASLMDGALTYGEYWLAGEQEDEILISCHICHPSLCNDNLSGISVTAFLAKHLGAVERRYSYRFLFIPGTIGSITWLSRNEHRLDRIKHGLVMACLGDEGPLTYKRTRRGDAEIDRAAEQVLKHLGKPYRIIDFSPYGYDERQFCSPGFNLPVGCLMRTPHGQFPQYHTSADDLGFITAGALGLSLKTSVSVLHVLEANRTYWNTNPKCEPQLGKRGLYHALGGVERGQRELAMLWVLNLSDGRHALLDIAERAGLQFSAIEEAADLLLKHGLLQPAPPVGTARVVGGIQ